ncbi:hypothetical protein BT96DRAFT_980028 [Gymnopus androsaceus JB14]|uniref:Uncharacterized protein n=1 Tax=Gymnopus androsaceus JB14 TaxID=1447944 RepID=A0A6A4GZZ0_9AGAR|nr:hypothetical protein BT96DRAFT_980028 [Gymnopus androsaceus JB14]
MVDIVSIVVAVVALLGTVAQAALTGWFGIHSDEKKRQDSLRATLSKYHDPLHLAADDLSVKLINIISYGFASAVTRGYSDPSVQAYSVIHTSFKFVFAQFFAWVNILRRDTEFLRPHTIPGSAGAEVIQLLSRIQSVLRSGYQSRFQIATGIQSAMGEIATVPESPDGRGQLRCIGFAKFCDRWRTEPDFKDWFNPIIHGIGAMANRNILADERLMILQHLYGHNSKGAQEIKRPTGGRIHSEFIQNHDFELTESSSSFRLTSEAVEAVVTSTEAQEKRLRNCKQFGIIWNV